MSPNINISNLNVTLYNKYKPRIKGGKLYWHYNNVGFKVDKYDFNARRDHIQGTPADIGKLKFIFELLN